MTVKVWIALALIVVACAAVCAVIAPPSNQGYRDGAAVIVFATLVATGIERVLEFAWSLVGQIKKLGQWWPFNRFSEVFDEFTTTTNTQLGPLLTNIENTMQQASAQLSGDALETHLANLAAFRLSIGGVRTELAKAGELAPGSARLALMRDAAANGLDLADAVVDASGTMLANYKATVLTIGQSLTIGGKVIEALKDNPARRIASILLGASLGLLIAGYFGLNLFSAILLDPADGGTTTGAIVDVTAGVVGIALTGIIIGLGSSPTHEVVKALQNYKARTGQQGDPSADPGDVVNLSGFPGGGPDLLRAPDGGPIILRRPGASGAGLRSLRFRRTD